MDYGALRPDPYKRNFQQLGVTSLTTNPTPTSVTYSVRSRAGHSDMSGYRCA